MNTLPAGTVLYSTTLPEFDASKYRLTMTYDETDYSHRTRIYVLTVL